MTMSMWEEVDRLKKELCELLTEKVKKSLNYDEARKRSEMEKELADSKALVERSKKSKDQLEEYYKERKEKKKECGAVASKEEFMRMKKEYFG